MNNVTYFDAAFSGAAAGLTSSRQLTSAVSANYNTLKAQALAIGTEVDSLIANETPTVPKANLIGWLTYAAFAQRGPILNSSGQSSTAAADYATIAAEIVAAYTNLSTTLL